MPLDEDGDAQLGEALPDWGDDPEALETLQSWLQAIAKAVSTRAADIAYLLHAGLSPDEVAAELDDVPHADAVHRTTHRLRERWDAVAEAQRQHPMPSKWAVRRWGRTLWREAQ